MWELSWELFFYILILFAGGVLFLNQIKAREVANQTAIRLCRQQNVAFLDGTVSFQKLWPRRNRLGRLKLQRYYAFDYLPEISEDIETARKTGFIVLLGDKVEATGFASEVLN